jgi:dTDP-glucose 4,6-dehydratase
VFVVAVVRAACDCSPGLLGLAVRILVTGGCGFIGSNFIRYILQHYKPAYVSNVDVLTYAGNPANLDGVVEEHGERYEFFKADIANADQMDALMTEHQFFAVINFAAESHVDRSINSPLNFIHTNVVGTSVLLDCARRHGVQRFVQISTDEVYGSLGKTGNFTEQSSLDPSSPYSASKAGADLLALACHRTYGQEVIVTRCSNNYGPYQFPEKLIPLMIIKALRGEPLPVYGDGLNVRDWIHVQDHCAAVVAALFEGKPGAIYNFGGGNEMVNLDVVKLILKKLGKPENLISFVTDRLGHDRRYAIDSSFAQRELKWKPLRNFEEGLDETIQWYLDHQSWWQPLLERAGRY